MFTSLIPLNPIQLIVIEALIFLRPENNFPICSRSSAQTQIKDR